MRIMVFDVPAENGGALTILNQYYNIAKKDKLNDWIFVVSTPKLQEQENIKVLRYPWVKNSWIHRLFFDHIISSKLVDKYDVHEILSLQNVIIPYTKVKQILYLHQPLPFVEKRYYITENILFWIYQNLISKLIYKSIKGADKIIVQTKWIMNAAIQRTGVDIEKFILKQPELNIKVDKLYENCGDKTLFFFPASGLSYKNHEVIINASKLLAADNINNYEIILTLDGNENRGIRLLKKIVDEHSLPIIFEGQINIKKVYEFYSKSILIFPSYIETFGLPLLEAKMHNCPIIASNCAFSHEILDDYNNVSFFDPNNSNELKVIIQSMINNRKAVKE